MQGAMCSCGVLAIPAPHAWVHASGSQLVYGTVMVNLTVTNSISDNLEVY